MTRPAIVFAAILIALVLLPAVVAALVHPGETEPYQLGHADHVPTFPPGMAPIDHTATVDPADQTTTTTARRSRQGTATIARPATATFDAGERRGIPCGGEDIPPCLVIERESMMTEDPLRVWNDQRNSDGGPIGCYYPPGHAGPNPCGSTASGPWQILRSTWDWFGGYLNAADAPLSVQIEKVKQLWARGAGCSHWRACRS